LAVMFGVRVPIRVDVVNQGLVFIHDRLGSAPGVAGVRRSGPLRKGQETAGFDIPKMGVEWDWRLDIGPLPTIAFSLYEVGRHDRKVNSPAAIMKKRTDVGEGEDVGVESRDAREERVGSPSYLS
jgi:hypothetical protein